MLVPVLAFLALHQQAPQAQTLPPSPVVRVVGQRVRLSASVYAASGDARDDRVTWRSSAPGRLRVSPEGVTTALAPGSATVTAAAGGAVEQLAMEVVRNTIASL